MAGVGQSERTPAKHLAMNRVLGQHAGAFCTPRVQRWLSTRQMMFVDATAGDGAGQESSSQLVLKHAAHLPARGCEPVVHMVEAEAGTFNALRDSVGGWSPSYVHLHHGDARQVIPGMERGQAALFLIDDPNHSGQSVLVEPVVEWAFQVPFTTVFCCIGANASGVARRPGHYEDSLDRLVQLLEWSRTERRYRRDAVFCRLSRDSHRWGYLVVTSEKFVGDVHDVFTKTMKELGGLVVYGFDDVIEQLVAQHTRSK